MIFSKILPLAFLSIGIFLLMQVISPVISYQFWLIGQSYSNQLLISPTQENGGKVLGVSIESKDNFPAIVSTLVRGSKANYSVFKLTIPKLKVESEQVFVDSNNLSDGLVHLPGSALPGEKGNVFISGHSALSKFFNLQHAAFANLTDIKKGDEIVIEANGSKFRYKVTSLKVVNPTDVSVINSPDELGRYISLMTCVPPGLNFKRLIVLGKMI